LNGTICERENQESPFNATKNIKFQAADDTDERFNAGLTSEERGREGAVTGCPECLLEACREVACARAQSNT